MTHTHRLTVENLSISHQTRQGVTPLVHDLSFSITGNAILGLAGESGSGKSLTCLAILGLLPPGITQTGGSIHLDGQEISALPPSRLRALRGRHIGTVLQNPMSCFDAVFTIRRHFQETLSAHGIAWNKKNRHRVREALFEVGFDAPDAVLDLYPFQMSGGMLQRAMIAIALIMNVSFLIADEPTTDLDVVSQERVLDLLDKLRTTHDMAILLVTHDLSVLARLTDRMIIMNKGLQVESGETRDIFAGGGDAPYTQKLLAAHFDLYGMEMQPHCRQEGMKGHAPKEAACP